MIKIWWIKWIYGEFSYNAKYTDFSTRMITAKQHVCHYTIWLSLKCKPIDFSSQYNAEKVSHGFCPRVLLLSLVSINKLLTTKAYGCLSMEADKNTIDHLNHLFTWPFKPTSKCVIYGSSIKMSYLHIEQNCYFIQ